MSKPDEYTPDRAAKIPRWKRNRDHCAGVDAVKDAGTKYLPQHSTMTADDYAAHKLSTEYLPASARTLQSHSGLVFRKAPRLSAPTSFEALANAITADGKTLEQLARWSFREFCITNDGGLLIDHPAVPDGPMSMAQAFALDLRPFVSRYSAEAILEITYGVVAGRKKLVRVRLLDDTNTVKQLEIIDGRYTITIFKMVRPGEWIEESSITPARNGQALTEIPFVHFRDEDDDGAIFDDICSTNLTHYQHASKLNTALLWLSAPKPWVAGLEADVVLETGPGSIWRFENSETKCGFLEFNGSGIAAIERQLDRLKESMAQLGSRLLATEKAVAEAAETVARRQASENSILASVARHVASRVEGALRLVAQWMAIDPQAISFELSTDFIPVAIDPQLVAQLVALNQAGKLTDRELFDALQRGEIIAETVDFEAHQAELDATTIDPPIGE